MCLSNKDWCDVNHAWKGFSHFEIYDNLFAVNTLLTNYCPNKYIDRLIWRLWTSDVGLSEYHISSNTWNGI